jgi:flagellar motor switch protein FliG
MTLVEKYDPARNDRPIAGQSGAGALTAPQKAAVIVRLLLSQDVYPGIDRLTHAHQADLTRAMSTLGPISKETLQGVVQEFTRRLDALALAAPHDLPGALSLLEPYISQIARDGLKAEADAGDSSDPWTKLAMMEADRLRPLLLTENAEVCAILLSKISVAKAASLLSNIPPERAHVIAHAVALTATVTPEMAGRIGESLLRQIQTAPRSAFSSSAVDRVGAILNAITGSARDELLDGITNIDEGFGNDVRRAIFTFEHIPRRVDPGDVPRILRKLETDVMVTALASGMKEAPLTVEFLLENMSKRLAEQMRDEAEAMILPRGDEGEAAMAQVVTAIRALEEEGELRLIPAEI